jgi:hypothetical protein
MHTQDDFIDIEKNEKFDEFKTSYIEDHEDSEAIEYIEKILGFKVPEVNGTEMAVKIYIRPEEIVPFVDKDGKRKALVLPSEAIANDPYRNCAALVLALGENSYKSSKFIENIVIRTIRKFFPNLLKPPSKRPYCKVGDWIMIPRNEGPQVKYKGVPITYLNCEKIYAVIQDPQHIDRYE